MVKTVGQADVLREALQPLAADICVALIYGSVARAEEQSGSDVGLLVVGNVGLSDLAPALKEAVKRLQRPINPMVYSPDEFARKAGSGHHLISNVVRGRRFCSSVKDMSSKALLAAQRLCAPVAQKCEVDALRAAVERDLRDAQVLTVSADRRFATAYNAALQLCKIARACAGYRGAAGPGHHQTTFEGAGPVPGLPASSYTVYFETCRRKRNMLDYDAACVATDTEPRELLAKAREFGELVEAWIARSFSHLRR